MSRHTPGSDDEAARRAERLAAELRANLQRRKAQTRARRAGAADERPDGLSREDGAAARDE